jgi:hypothetical protein
MGVSTAAPHLCRTLITRASRFDPAVQRAGCEARIARANRRAADLAPIIDELRAAGITSSKAIAKALDKLGVPTLSGRGHWHPMQVSRLLRRLAGAETLLPELLGRGERE